MARVIKFATIGLFALGVLVIATAPDLLAEVTVKEALKYTKDLKTSKDPKVRATAITELGKAGQIQRALVTEAEPEMVKALDDKDVGVRTAAAKAVGMIDPDPAAPIIEKLVKMMKDDKEIMEVRAAAADGLGALGEKGKPAAKELREYANMDKDKKSKLTTAAKNALKQINPKK